ncbi:hypothetical protein CL634_09770 [bacterium]|nr:hypothetical protein [bacterium]|tara:strand:+ start:1352 stop:1780 length:429 start_codon:yes stop_codon:yes gene_type:complete
MSTFQNRFLKILTEQPEVPVEPEVSETDALAGTLDPGTEPAAYDVPDNPEVALKQQQTARTITTIKTWIDEVEGFIEYLNGTEQGSINFTLNSADCDSLLSDVQRSESKKISRLAQDLSSLGEALKQYLLLANRKQSHADSI